MIVLDSVEKQHKCNHNLIKTGQTSFSGEMGRFFENRGSMIYQVENVGLKEFVFLVLYNFHLFGSYFKIIEP